jgi:hypothetical protein
MTMGKNGSSLNAATFAAEPLSPLTAAESHPQQARRLTLFETLTVTTEILSCSRLCKFLDKRTVVVAMVIVYCCLSDAFTDRFCGAFKKIG